MTKYGWVALVVLGSVGCGDDGGTAACDFALAFTAGTEGHADPLGVGPGQARAGRLAAADVPVSPSGLGTWAAGDFVLANEKVAMIIEDVGASDLYDPWGGRPIGVARVEGGALVDLADYGEFFLLTGRYAIVTSSVSVINDGSDGNPAVVRAWGTMAPLPFLEVLVGPLLRDDFNDMTAALDYSLAPGADVVEIKLSHHSPRLVVTEVPTTLHGFMYTPRTPTYAPKVGFDTASKNIPYLAFVDDDATGWAFMDPDEVLGSGVSASGFTSNFTDGYEIAACGETARDFARLVIGGPGLDGLRAAVSRTLGQTDRTLTGVVRDANGAPAAGVRVHAETDTNEYITRTSTGADGSYTLRVPDGQAVALTAFRRGDAVVGPIAVPAAQATADLALAAAGTIHVTAVDADAAGALPVRVQVLPVTGDPPGVPAHFGEPGITGGRVHVDFALTGESTLRVPVGTWRVVVSRGYEYEIHDEEVTVTADATAEVAAVLDRVVDTTGVLCADYHVHTNRSADSGDPAPLKVASAVADGLELPIRSEHEYAEDFQPVVEALGMQAWAKGMTSVELTTMEAFGHFGVLPIDPDPSEVNGGTPAWQTFPSAADPDAPVVTLEPVELFAQVRARPEQPIIIINHPRGGANYFDYAGYDNTTGMAFFPTLWDEQFEVVEVFNDSSWTRNRNGTVADWLSFLNNGRRVFAVGSSDSHGVSSSPVGYPRTCLALGTDDPAAVTPGMVRDATAAGHATISGGIYLDASVGNAGPGDEVTGASATTMVQVKVQAASWVDVDWIEIVVDGETVDTIAILPQDADPGEPTIRFDAPIAIQVAPGAGSYVIVAAYGDEALEPVHPGRQPFAVTNPIFLRQ
ncbi:MAG TPA: CehA/McbA family metallohydrolase [Kofleriaceae bacterium]|nr:CehA/McbA family metallohydrolase [Kofleriaceae bacterium]